MKTSYSYKDIVLQPAYSEVRSRSKLDASVEFLGRRFESAAIPANMKCTVDFKKAKELSEAGYFYVLHRFYDYEDILDWMVENKDMRTISISIGVNKKDYDFIDEIIKRNIGVDFITIDVAHGHHILVKHMITYINNKLRVNIIAGNVGTYQAAKDLYDWGADAVKVGLSMGKSCLHPDMLIKTNDGYKRISEISIGDYVLTHRGDYKCVEDVIQNINTEEMLEINGVVCTKTHEFYIIDKCNESLIKDDSDILKYGKWLTAEEIDEEQHLVIELDP
jgi:hydrogenase maturation factor